MKEQNGLGCIEFVGCTGAGKSTLVNNILCYCHSNAIEAILGEDFALRQVGLEWVKKRLVRQVLVNLVSLASAMAAWQRYQNFYGFVLQVLFRLPIEWAEKLYIGRNVFKNIGLYEIARRATTQQVILLDEGPLQIAHYLFVHLSIEPPAHDIDTFAGLTPLPDVVVHLRPEESILVERTLARGHKRIPGGSRSTVERFIHRAVATFDQLVFSALIHPRLLIVEHSNKITTPVDRASPFVETIFKILRAVVDQAGAQGDLHAEAAVLNLSMISQYLKE